MSTPYVIDRDNVIWLVAYDGGMAVRGTDMGAVSAGMQWLQDTAGPLRPFDPANYTATTDTHPVVSDMAKAAYWEEVREDGHPWSSERDAFEDGFAQGYARAALNHAPAAAPTEEHESDPDQVMSRVIGVCWHSPTADRWPCGGSPSA